MRKAIMALEGLEEVVEQGPAQELTDRGISDERDMDFIENLNLPGAYEVATEGITKAKIHDIGNTVHAGGTELKGWFLGIESKQKYIEESCNNIITWLKNEQEKHPDLSLDMGKFKTWMKTSAAYNWRYYFLLHDDTWEKIKADLKKDDKTALEKVYNINFKDRTETTDHLDAIKDIKGLITIVQLYIKRSNQFFDLVSKQKSKIKGAPFQVILLGAADLRLTVKKIVNLAV